jgi:hypothetical protein
VRETGHQASSILWSYWRGHGGTRPQPCGVAVDVGDGGRSTSRVDGATAGVVDVGSGCLTSGGGATTETGGCPCEWTAAGLVEQCTVSSSTSSKESEVEVSAIGSVEVKGKIDSSKTMWREMIMRRDERSRRR